MTDVDSEIVEDTKNIPLADVTDDSCELKLIEIVPLDRTSDDDYKREVIPPVKPEVLQDVKQELADDYDTEDACLTTHPQVSSCVETAANDIHFPVEVTGGGVKPVHINTDLLDYHSTVDEETSEDLTQSCSDKSRGLLQTSHSTEQSVFSSECVRVDTSNQLDTAEDCKQSDTPCDDQMHVENTKHICDVCNKNFTRSSYLKTHLLIHKGERPFSCEVCDKKFTHSSNLKSHMLVHTGERPFSCEVCNKKFTSSSKLRSHMLLHTGEYSFSCEVCSKKFTCASNLKRHMCVHNGERPFICVVCGKKFLDSSQLKRHMFVHNGERPFICTVCDKRFTRLSHLNNHMLIHTGERPFTCHVCSKKFIDTSSLKRHVLIHKGQHPL